MLFPKKVKFRKWQTQRSNPKANSPETRGIKLSFGSYGLKALTQARVKSNQIESARKVISRTLTKAGKYWVRIFQTDLLLLKLQRWEWEKEKEIHRDTVLMFILDVLYLK